MARSRLLFVLFFLLGVSKWSCSQTAVLPERPYVQNPGFDEKLTRLLAFTVPLIGVGELKNIRDEVAIFDTREWREYEISHIPGARYVGFTNFNPGNIKDISKDSRIIVYCSVGYRSEKIGEKLRKLGYRNVYNLYGSIFEWVNQGNPVIDRMGNPGNRLHTYNKDWSRWVDDGRVKKVW